MDDSNVTALRNLGDPEQDRFMEHVLFDHYGTSDLNTVSRPLGPNPEAEALFSAIYAAASTGGNDCGQLLVSRDLVSHLAAFGLAATKERTNADSRVDV